MQLGSLIWETVSPRIYKHIIVMESMLILFLQNQQRELTVRHARETEKEMKKRLDVQKDEYEETIKRHLSFIDQVRRTPDNTLNLDNSKYLLISE